MSAFVNSCSTMCLACPTFGGSLVFLGFVEAEYVLGFSFLYQIICLNFTIFFLQKKIGIWVLLGVCAFTCF